jgi:hypothetical protein
LATIAPGLYGQLRDRTRSLHPRYPPAKLFQVELALGEMGTPSLLVALDYLELAR